MASLTQHPDVLEVMSDLQHVESQHLDMHCVIPDMLRRTNRTSTLAQAAAAGVKPFERVTVS